MNPETSHNMLLIAMAIGGSAGIAIGAVGAIVVGAYRRTRRILKNPPEPASEVYEESLILEVTPELRKMISAKDKK